MLPLTTKRSFKLKLDSKGSVESAISSGSSYCSKLLTYSLYKWQRSVKRARNYTFSVAISEEGPKLPRAFRRGKKTS